MEAQSAKRRYESISGVSRNPENTRSRCFDAKDVVIVHGRVVDPTPTSPHRINGVRTFFDDRRRHVEPNVLVGIVDFTLVGKAVHVRERAYRCREKRLFVRREKPLLHRIRIVQLAADGDPRKSSMPIRYRQPGSPDLALELRIHYLRIDRAGFQGVKGLRDFPMDADSHDL